jgi:hypothetical protein
MPLLDHFRAPLYPTYSWESFHSRWANSIGDALNRQLPRRYMAEIRTHVGTYVEADVAEFERPSPDDEGNGQAGGVAVRTWAPPAATLTMPLVYPDEIGVEVFDTRGGATLVAVVELVSPRNKDRPESRRGFAAKCAAYLERGIGVVAADIVTTHHFNPHNELVALLGLDDRFTMPAAGLSAVAYRPVRRDEKNEADVWAVELAVGSDLPVLPLALRGAGAVPLDLNATYDEARQRSRL